MVGYPGVDIRVGDGLSIDNIAVCVILTFGNKYNPKTLQILQDTYMSNQERNGTRGVATLSV